MIRTIQLLRYLSDPALRRRVTAATNKTEAFNGFSQWIGFGNRGVIAEDLRHHDIQLELLTGPLQGVYDPSGHGAGA